MTDGDSWEAATGCDCCPGPVCSATEPDPAARALSLEIEGAAWGTYRKQTATWAVKLPVDVTVRTDAGEVEAEGGDYLAIDNRGELYPIDAEEFEQAYQPATEEWP